MSSTTPGRPSAPVLTNKKSSSTTSASGIKRATSNDDIADTNVPTMKKESSSGFNYQSLTETTPLNAPKVKTKQKQPVRSHSSTNAELSYHLQQLSKIGIIKPTITGDERNNNEERIRLTSSNLKVECDELGTGIHTTMQVETIETSIELPVSWKPAIQQMTIQRDAWDHKVEFLLAVIGYAVDLGI
jgi:hypothetical protein